MTEPVVVFNGDVLTEIDLAAVVRLHRERRARATIVLTPVDNPSAYGLVETDPQSNILRFREKPKPHEITTRNINAGVYILEPDTFDRIPSGVPWSIERGYFPSLVERGETFVAYLYDGYWIDIGTPEKYVQVHHDIMDGRFAAAPFRHLPLPRAAVSVSATVAPDATVEGPCFVDDGAVIQAGARIGRHAVIGRGVTVGANAVVEGAIIWPNTTVGADAVIRGAIVGRACRLGASVSVGPGAIIGDGTMLTDFSQA
jgi:NDP-sugar pyrophosphorylase family protein